MKGGSYEKNLARVFKSPIIVRGIHTRRVCRPNKKHSGFCPKAGAGPGKHTKRCDARLRGCSKLLHFRYGRGR